MDKISKKLQDERSKAYRVLQGSSVPESPGFNLSDFKTDRTQYFDSPKQFSESKNAGFEPSEITARSTTLKSSQSGNKAMGMMLDIDEIMRTSECQEVRNKYRESIANRPSRIPEERSYRATMTNDANSTSSSSFWDHAKIAQSSFSDKNATIGNSESFKPAEQMMDQLYKDQLQQEQEYAAIPRADSSKSNSNWQDSISQNQPEMSFGAYFNKFGTQSDIREIYNAESPPKRSNRMPMVDLTNESVVEDSVNVSSFNQIRKMLQSVETPTISKATLPNYSQMMNDEPEIVEEIVKDLNIQSCSDMLDSLNFDKTKESAKKQTKRSNRKKAYENELSDILPTKENDFGDENSNPNRGQKRRPSLLFVTPTTHFEKLLRAATPNKIKGQRDKMSNKLKPAVSESAFKVPQSVANLDDISPFRSREYSSTASTEKLSLPSYNLAKTKSPSSSQISRESGQLKRTTSQMSTGSEFSDENLPLKFQKCHRRISFPSVRLQNFMTLAITVQNGSDKKLPLTVKIQGACFSVNPSENFRMLPHEVRTFNIKFMPTTTGAFRGDLIFELSTNSNISKKIPLYGYGGHSSIRVEGIQKAPIGPQFLTMGLVKNVNTIMERKIKFTNVGTLPGFAIVVFNRSKITELCSEESVNIYPEELRLPPGETKEVIIRFRAKKEEIRKIVNENKEVSVVGEIYILCGDEPTRLRLLMRRDQIPLKLSECLPANLSGEEYTQQCLAGFNENFDDKTLTSIIQRINTHNIALTLDRNLDETQIIEAQISLSDESMSFCETDLTVLDNEWDDKYEEDEYYLESKHFRIFPAVLIFDRSSSLIKTIKVQSTSNELHFVETVSSHPRLMHATKPCGQLRPGNQVDVNVAVQREAFDCEDLMQVTIMVENARICVPVRFQ